MRTKFSGILTLLLAFVVQLTFAQEKTISGTVSDNTGLPLPGVNIIVKGTSNGTQSDFDGNYSVQASVGQTLVYSYVGFKSAERAVTASSGAINLQMDEDAAVLEEVVVTAQGIRKEKKALGYAVSSIKEESIKNNPETDLTRILQGKSAGVNITAANGLAGSTNKVIIRGLTSFNGGNNALYIVDGVPYSNDTNASGNFLDGNNGSSRALDLDPSNIERIDVLKGLAAATLYGADGKNGVILITTKTGSVRNTASKQEVQISSSYFLNQAAALPDYQNQYGGGFDQAFGWFFSNWGPGFFRDGLGGWGNDIAFDENGTLPHPYSTSAFLAANYPDYQAQFFDENGDNFRYDWKPRTSVVDFFRTGATASNSVNVKGRSEDGKFDYGVSFAHVKDEGILPGNEVTRNNLTVAGGAKLSNKINVRGSMTYTRTKLKSPPVAASGGSGPLGAGSSIFSDLIYTPRSIDIFGLPFEAPDGASIYYRDDNAIQHPLWTLKHARFSQNTNRVNGYGSIDYSFNDNINLLYQGSVDTYFEESVNLQNRGGVTGDVPVDSGFYSTVDNRVTTDDHKMILSGSGYSFFNDNINFGFDIGATTRTTQRNRIGTVSDGQQFFDFFNHSNFLNQRSANQHSRFNTIGAFAQLSVDYDNAIFLNFAGRNDWVSNAVNNSQFYPSFSASILPTKLFPGIQSENGISYLKLRTGYGTSAGFSGGFPVATLLNIDTQDFLDSSGAFVVSNTTDTTIGNSDIKPELITELEFGIEGKLFSRLTFDVSYYDRITKDLISLQLLPASSGALQRQTNIGEIEANGLEVDLGLDVFNSSDGFNWNIGVNFTKAETEVTDLGPDADINIYAGFTNLGNGARVGFPLGAMFGSRVARNENGDLLVDAAGNYVAETVDEEGILPFIGDPNPDYVMNISNTFSYKGFSLSATVNHTSGGDVYSQTIATLLGRGLTTDTADRLSTYILPGVSQATGLPNDIAINNSDYYFGNIFAGPAAELSVFDASVVRLQDVSLAYALPSKLLEKTPFGNITIKVSGQNLWYDAYNTPEGTNFDPNTTGLGAGNGQGFEYITGPSNKRYGFSINATF